MLSVTLPSDDEQPRLGYPPSGGISRHIPNLRTYSEFAPYGKRYSSDIRRRSRIQMQMLRCFEIDCHSDPAAAGEESRPDPCPAIPQTQSEIPRFGRNDISWFPGARQQTGMNDCHENACAAGAFSCQVVSQKLIVSAHRMPCFSERRNLVRKGGLEPPPLTGPDPKSGASANSATFAPYHYKPEWRLNNLRKNP